MARTKSPHAAAVKSWATRRRNAASGAGAAKVSAKAVTRRSSRATNAQRNEARTKGLSLNQLKARRTGKGQKSKTTAALTALKARLSAKAQVKPPKGVFSIDRRTRVATRPSPSVKAPLLKKFQANLAARKARGAASADEWRRISRGPRGGLENVGRKK